MNATAAGLAGRRYHHVIGSEGATSGLAQGAGVDALAARQTSRGDPLEGQVLVFGEHLSARIHLAYEQGMTTATAAVKLTHDLTPRICVVTRGGGDGAIGVYYRVASG